jgi:hypothetical protein
MLGMAAPTEPIPQTPRVQVAPARPPGLAHAGTMIGMQSPFAPAPQAPQAGGQPVAAQPPAPQQQLAPPATSGPARAGLKQTMLGFAPPGVLAQAAPASAPVPSAPHTPQVASGGTLAQATPVLPGAIPPPAAPQPAPQAPRQPGAQRPMHQQTMLGVARPGIAPLHAGQARPEPPPAAAPVAAPAPAPAAAAFAPSARSGPSSSPDEPIVARRPGLPKGAVVLVAVAALLAVTAGVVAFLWESPRPIRAEVVLDDRGAEALALTCDDCADGTTVASGSSKVTFTGKKAQLPLSRPLEIGKNEIVVAVHRQGIGRDEEVKLLVAVDYRVRGVLTSLTEDPPKVKVAVQATPGAAAVVDGRPVTLDASGKGEHAIDVSRDLEGPADAILPFERKLPYAVTPPGGAAHQGEVTLRFGIVPLRIDAPGDGIVVEGETFMLSGRTLKDGRVTVSGRPITVDAEGRFAQLMNVSSIGETKVVVRAEAKDQAPRLVRVHVKRVASLKDEATIFRQSATDQFSSLEPADAKKGLSVALDGEVAEARLDGEVTVLLLDVKRGCTSAPCLAKVVYGGRLDAKKGATLEAFGHLVGSVEGPRTGVKIPEIAAEFLLPRKNR